MEAKEMTNSQPAAKDTVVEELTPQRSEAKRIFRRLLKNRRAVVGGILLLIIILMAIFAPLWPPRSVKQNIRNRRRAQAESIFWDGPVGRDTFSRVVYGSGYRACRVFCNPNCSSVSCLLGLWLVYGKLDNNMRIMDVLMALPGFCWHWPSAHWAQVCRTNSGHWNFVYSIICAVDAFFSAYGTRADYVSAAKPLGLLMHVFYFGIFCPTH